MAGSFQLTKEMEGRSVIISPSLLSADVLNMESDIERIEKEVEWFHLDIMDGHFVPNLSYGPSLLKALRKRYPDKFIDVHIMVEPPEAFTGMFLAERPSVLTVHAEATPHIHRVLQSIRNEGVPSGVSINPGTPVELLYPVLHMADLVLLEQLVINEEDRAAGIAENILDLFFLQAPDYNFRTSQNHCCTQNASISG